MNALASSRLRPALPGRGWLPDGLARGGFLLLLLLLLVVTGARPAGAQVGGAIAVYPESSSLEIGATRQFSAYVPISPNTVTWSVNDVVGGNSVLGTISAAGLYQAPAVAPGTNTVTVRARSTAYPSSVGAATLTITRKYPWLWSVSPSALRTGAFQASLNGANFATDSVVLLDGQPLATTFVSSTRLTVTRLLAQAGTAKFAVRQPAPGAVTGNVVSVTVTVPTVTVALQPATASVDLGASRTFTATVTGTNQTAVTWSVNGVNGGSSTVGTITTAGIYTAPSVMPASATVTVRATSVAAPTAFAQSTVTLTIPPAPPVTVAVTPGSATVLTGASAAFTATVTGTNVTAVTWSVNGVTGGSAALGTISAAGVYTAPAVLPANTNLLIRATSVASPTSSGTATVGLAVPPVAPVSPARLAAARYLEQSSFGPTPATLADVMSLGIEAHLEAQFLLPSATIPAPSGNSMGSLRQWMLTRYTTAPDQLRQRVAYALSQILVTSATKLVYADEMLPWLQILSDQAFGNYRDLLRSVTLSPSMGKFLDLANSTKPGVGGGANENYPRELLQLFTIGLWQLKQDGTLLLVNGAPVPTYDQETIAQVALALTGWTYATAPGATPQAMNWEYFGAPMEPRPQNHDPGPKSFLGCSLPAGQTPQQDLESVLDCLMLHTNTAPFVATRLIRSLVTSNPSEAYVTRVADVFVDNGAGIRGDLRSVVRAILLDPEARNDAAPPNQGRLREPILQAATFLRALNGRFTDGQQITYLFDYMAQGVLAPPSVFSWFSPLYRVPKSPLYGPEFQIYTPTEATLRGNLFHSILSYSGGDHTVDLSPFQPYGSNLPALVEKVNEVLLHGRMPAGMKQVLINAAQPGYDAKTRIETVLYLTALSGQFAVQH